MLIIIDTLFCIVRFETELLYHFENFRLSRDRILANNQSLILTYRLILFEPPMFADVFGCKASFRIRI